MAEERRVFASLISGASLCQGRTSLATATAAASAPAPAAAATATAAPWRAKAV